MSRYNEGPYIGLVTVAWVWQMLQFCWKSRRPRVTPSFAEPGALPPFCARTLSGNNKTMKKKAIDTYFMRAPADDTGRIIAGLTSPTHGSTIAPDSVITVGIADFAADRNASIRTPSFGVILERPIRR